MLLKGCKKIMKQRVENLQSLIPENWYKICVENEDELIFLGSKNLESLQRYWQEEFLFLSKHGDSMCKKRDDWFCDRLDLVFERPADALKGSKNNPERLEKIKARIDYLAQMMELAEDKPCFTVARLSCQHFVEGNRVVLFAPYNQEFFQAVKKMFAFGKVFYCYWGYGGIDIEMDERFYTRFLDGSRWGIYSREVFLTVRRPEILLLGEFEYLKNDPAYLEMWLQVAEANLDEWEKSMHDFKIAEFRNALLEK